MQEEVENRTVNLAISTTKLTVNALITGFRRYGQHLSAKKSQRTVKKNQKALAAKSKDNTPHGKQTVKELVGQNQGVTSIPMEQTNIRGFTRIAGKYGIDYAITKDKSVTPTRYLIFFKARDADALTAAMREFITKNLGQKKAASVLGELEQTKETAITAPEKVRKKEQELSR